MRRFDKTKNIIKANLLAEQRYLESKGFITENQHNISEDLHFKKGFGYWDVTKYPYGGDFKRFDGIETGTHIEGPVKFANEIRVKLNDGRTIVVKKDGVLNNSNNEINEPINEISPTENSKDFIPNEIFEFEEENPLYSRQEEFGINSEKGENNLNSEINFDRIFDEIFSMEPEYDYDESSSGRLSGRYGSRNTSDGDTTATFHNDDLSILLIISYSNHWDEDPDGASYWGNLSMSYENWADFGDAKLDDMITKFGEIELIKENPNSGHNGTSVEEVKRYNMINTEFMDLLSDKTKEKLYNQIESLIDKNAKYQRFDDY